MKWDPYAMAVEQEPRHHVVIPNELVRGFAVELARTIARCAIITRKSIRCASREVRKTSARASRRRSEEDAQLS